MRHTLPSELTGRGKVCSVDSQLPTKPGPYYWREKDGDEWARVFDVQLSNSIGLCVDAGFYYESVQQRGGQWLPIPTAEELVELLRLVDGVRIDMEQLHSQSESMTDECLLKGIRDGATGCFSDSVRAAMQRLCGLFNSADKLRKEIGE